MSVSNDVAFIIKAGNNVVPMDADHQIQTDELVVANADTKFVVIKNGIPTLVNESCPTCVMLSAEGPQTFELDANVSFDTEAASEANFSLDDITAIQNAILAGEDPTQVLEAAAAGNAATGSANNLFVVIDYDNNQTLAQAGFDTANAVLDVNEIEDERVAILATGGGNSASMSVVEGDLAYSSGSTYPVETSQSVTVTAGSLSLDPASFTFEELSLNSLLAELNSEMTLNGKPLEFIFDPDTVSIIGSQNGQLVLTIDLNSSASGKDVILDITTTLYQPLDHIADVNNSGLVSNLDDQININLAIQGADISNNNLNNLINIDVTINDGADPLFDTDQGVIINETAERGDVISGNIPLDVGSDAIDTINFTDDQPSLSGVTSNGGATTVLIDGNTLTLVDSDNSAVMTVTIETDGSYKVTVLGPIGQNGNDTITFDLAVIATDKDGDKADGAMQITINDSTEAAGGEQVEIALVEGDLDVNGDGIGGTDTSYPVSASGLLVINAGEDRLLPETIEIDPTQVAALIAELQADLTSDNEALIFTVNSDGDLVGTIASGDVAVIVTLDAVQQGQGISVTISIEQHLPLDHNNTGDNAGYVTSLNDEIRINVPLQATDTDDEKLTTPADANITIKDGVNPIFSSTTSEMTEVEGSQSVSGAIGLNVGSDGIAGVTFSAEQTSFEGLTTNGQATTVSVNGNELIVSIDGGNNDGAPVLTININDDGSYTIKQDEPLDQVNSQTDNVELTVAVIATDNDGDVSNTGQIQITIKDGLNATGNNITANLILVEGQNSAPGNNNGYPATVGGNFTVEAVNDNLLSASMRIDTTVQAALLTELNALTSNGEVLTFTSVVDGNGIVSIIGVTESSTGIPTEILSITLTPVAGVNGDVSVAMAMTQNGSLDQLAGISNEYVKVVDDSISITIPVQMNDSDGDDLEQPVNVVVTINDGSNAVGGQTGSLSITEGDLIPGTPDAGYPVSNSTTITVPAGVDRLDPASVEIDAAVLAELITELEAELTAGGQSLTFSYDVDSKTLVGKVGGVEILSLAVSAVQTTDSSNVDITLTITQSQPLDHQDGNTEGMVSIKNDQIAIDVPIQVADTDGDKLDNNILITATINDGGVPVIIGSQVFVEERDINGSNSAGIHTGSNPGGSKELANGQVTITSGSDEVVDFKVDVAAFNAQNDITSAGNKISLVADGDPKGLYLGIADNGKVVFAVQLNTDGTYTFEIKGPIDHNIQGKDTISIEIPVFAVDQDGDVSSSVNVSVDVIDDTPSINNKNITVTEGMSNKVDVLSSKGEGADSATITSVDIDGNGNSVDGNNFNNNHFAVYDDLNSGELLGWLDVKANGVIRFTANPDLDQDKYGQNGEIVKTITINVTDGDGDTTSKDMSIVIRDQDATLTTFSSTGQEDGGEHNDDQIPASYTGITINMDIDAGDSDRGESVGLVTVTPVGDIHGVFMWNGNVIIANSDGSFTLDPSAFTYTNGVFVLQGVTFKPDEDFSTISGDLTFKVNADVVNADGSLHSNVKGNFDVHVDGVADIPTWDEGNTTYHYSVMEDSEDNPKLNLSALLEDNDGANTSSEDLYYFISIVDGQGSLIGDNLVETPVDSGVYKVAAADIDSVHVDPADNFSGDIKLKVYAQSEERDNQDTAVSIDKEIIINVQPSADPASMKVQRIEANEDELINLNNYIVLTSADDNSDGSEVLYVRISDLPDGAELILDGAVLQANTDGQYEVPYADIDKLQLKPTPESNLDFNFKVESVVKDSTMLTDANGIVSEQVDLLIGGAQTIDVRLTGVADAPKFDVSNTLWSVLPSGELETTIDEDGSAKFDFSVVSGELELAPDDKSETLSMVLSNIPEGVKVFDSEGNESALVYVGQDAQGNAKYEVTLSSLKGITISPPEHSTKDIELAVRLVVTENDGDSNRVDSHLIIHIEPAIDAMNYAKNSNGQEDGVVNLNWQPDLVDNKEKITGLILEGLPAGYDLYIGGNVIAQGTGVDITLSAEQVEQITSGNQSFTVKGPEDSDVDLVLTTKVTITEKDVDSLVETEKVITGTLNIDIRAVVEADGELVAPQGLTVMVSDSEGVIDLSQTGATGQITFSHGDNSSEEDIVKLVLDGIPEGFVIVGGINNGDGSWTIPESSLDDLKIIAPNGYTGTIKIGIHAEVKDAGDNNEGDTSKGAFFDSVLTLDFSGNISSSTQEASDITYNTDDTVHIIGTEDNVVNLGEQMAALKVLSIDSLDNVGSDDFTLVISASSLPAGATISGMEFNFETNEYVLKVPVNESDGSIDFSAVKLNLPTDFAGDFKLDVRYVTTDTKSGDVKEADATLDIKISPVVDVPAEVSFNVISPDGLAYEDGDITLDLNVVLGDLSTTENEGLEETSLVTLTLDNPSQGAFISSNGILVTTITLSASALDTIQFRPVEDFSGKVNVSVKLDITDTAHFDEITVADQIETAAGSHTSTVSFDVVAVNDEIDWVQTDPIVIGTEDSAVSLLGIGGTLTDSDGSEVILSIKLTDVPEGFVIDGAVNNSNGEWSISLPPGQTTFNLDNISLIPPRDFSGEVELNVVVYSKENSLTEVKENSTSISIEVQPRADGVDTDIETQAEGKEQAVEGIELILNIEALDDQASYEGSASNVQEKGAETLQIILSNIPDSSSIALPDGVTGTVTKMNDGTWLVTTNSSDLDKLIFHPGDANNVNWNGDIGVEISSVDNGVVADITDVLNSNIHVDVEAENDAAINILPAELITDEDASTVINGIQVNDVDFGEIGDSMSVTLQVGHGILGVALPSGSDLVVNGQGTNTLVLTGTLDEVNALLNNGVTYEGDNNYSGADELTMTTDDGGNGDNVDYIVSKIPVTVIPKADTPSLSLDPRFIQTATIRGSINTLIPLLGLMAAVADASETLMIEVHNVGLGQLVNSDNQPLGNDLGNGVWLVSKADLADLHVMGLSEGENTLKFLAISEESDGSTAESAAVDIKVMIDDLSKTDNTIDASKNVDGQKVDDANLVIDSSASATLLGGGGDDILIGGEGSDILVGGAGDDTLWGGEQNASGDNFKDIFAWQVNDFGRAGNVAADTIMDFEVRVDKIDLSDAFSTFGSMSLNELTQHIKLTSDVSDTSSSIFEIYDANDDLVQTIKLNGVSQNALLGEDPAGMSDEDKLTILLNSGQLQVGNNFADNQDNTLIANDSGEFLYGFEGHDILTGGSGDDILSGGDGDDLFTWQDTSTNTDVITDFELGQDQLDLSQILSTGNDDTFGMDDLLEHVTSGDVTANYSGGNVNISVNNSESGDKQNIVLENMDSAGFSDNTSQADILNQLFNQDAFKVDPNL